MKYVLWNKKKRLYFVRYEGRNKPIWCIHRFDATEYDILVAQRLIKRLACQSQIVELCIQQPKLDFDEKQYKSQLRDFEANPHESIGKALL